MRPGTTNRAWEDLLPLDQVTPHTSHNLGMEYHGEIVRGGAWSVRWAEPLSGGRHYRIVLLENRPVNTPQAPEDKRIAVCLTSPESSRRLAKLSGELETTNQAGSLTRRSPDAATVAESLRERRIGLEAQIKEEQCLRYAGGVVAAGSAGPDPAAIFAGHDLGRLAIGERLSHSAD